MPGHCNFSPRCSADTVKPKKFLAWQTEEDLYQSYVAWSDHPACKATFRSVRHDGGWKRFLGIRKISQHARCAICAEITEKRKKAENPEDKATIQDLSLMITTTTPLDYYPDGLTPI